MPNTPKGTQSDGNATGGTTPKQNNNGSFLSMALSFLGFGSSGTESSNTPVPQGEQTSAQSQGKQTSADSSEEKKRALEELRKQLELLQAQSQEIYKQMQALSEDRSEMLEDRTEISKQRASATETSPEAEQEKEELSRREEALSAREAELNEQEEALRAEKQKLKDDQDALNAARQKLTGDQADLATGQAALATERADIQNQIDHGVAARLPGEVSARIAARDTAQAQRDLTTLQRELTYPISRARILKSMFVDEYKGKKEQERKELERNLAAAAAGGPPPAPVAPPPPGVAPSLANVPLPAAGAAPAQPEKHWYDDVFTTEKANEKFIEYSKIGNIANAGWSAVDGFLDTSSDTKDHMTQIDRFANNGLALGNAALGGTQNCLQLAVNHKKRGKTKDKAKHASLTWNSIGSGFSLVGNLTTATGSIIGLSTDMNGRQKTLDKWNEKHKPTDDMDNYTTKTRDVLRTADWMSGLSAGLSFLGTASKYIGNVRERTINKNTAETLEAEKIKDDAFDSQEYAQKVQLSTALDAAGGNKTDANYRAQLDQYKVFKAKKYTMEQARQFRQNKGGKRQLVKGAVGLASSAVSAGSSLASVFSNSYKKSTPGRIFRGFLPAIGIAVNKVDEFINNRIDDSVSRNAENIKLGEIDKYLIKKRDKVRADIVDKFHLTRRNELDVGDNEIDRITLGRLGVDIQVVNDPLSNEDKLKAFEQLNLKRAKQIMDISDDTTRN